MKKTIDNNYELYTKKTSGTASIILDSSTNTTKSNINLRADGIIEKSYNDSKKYYGGGLILIPYSGTTTIAEINVPIYSSISVRCNFNVYKNLYANYSYTSEKNALFVRGASGNISQIGTTSNIFETSNFTGVLGKIIVNGTKVSITLDTPIYIGGEYVVANVVCQVNYEYTIVTNTDLSEGFGGFFG
jgi:hypothetical protein